MKINCSFTCSSTHLPDHSSVCLFAHPLICSSACLLVHSIVRMLLSNKLFRTYMVVHSVCSTSTKNTREETNCTEGAAKQDTNWPVHAQKSYSQTVTSEITTVPKPWSSIFRSNTVYYIMELAKNICWGGSIATHAALVQVAIPPDVLLDGRECCFDRVEVRRVRGQK